MMTMLRYATRLIAFGAAFLAAVPFVAQAQSYPSRAIKIVVPYPAGAAGDILARLYGEHASQKLGQPIVVDNRPGGAGIAATESVARAAPDGYTLLLTGPNHVTNVGLFPSLPYDPVKDFAFISVIGTDYVLIMANPKAGFSTVQELIAKAKAAPKSINYASSGIGTGGHLGMEVFQKAAGIELFHIPYKGASPALTDTASGQVPMNITAYSAAQPFIANGRLIPLVVGGPKRLAPLPNVPTTKEIGLEGAEVGTWFGLSAPARTPPEIINLLAVTVAEAVKSEKIKARQEASATTPGGNTPAEFTALIEAEMQRWPKLIRDLGIKAE
jgi:tripartite-type tricarboxylate transporter receptor subunit TctC